MQKCFQKDIISKLKTQKNPNKVEETRLQAEIDKLQYEISEIVGEIGKIKFQIKNLETDQK
ncbi:MAG: hypothetical protein Q8894_02470 [Sweet potato little leaf phytoplasma]|nr:hypothetical protein [Candidatus Phytoplasma australasiaticum]MDV3204624.1 hypothetical protein [Sweet potato little leaf phytoplasma]MDV3153826.1 hypothetical protein [Candidatus Phytoplasma australasiaticum]MDV3167667.1 hypothetical protein [Candidatus Phytoplasma australasiaticum]MDV3181045.1 hypothetical protein [Candidatus Phytoplasma australasiaticum]